MKLRVLLLLLLLFNCENQTESLPVLSYTIIDSGEKVNYSITYDNFTNQLGESFTTQNLEQNICIANFFFTRCPSICPPMRIELIDIANTFKDDNNFIIISHTIDPKNDSIYVLKNYAEATGIPNEKWQFLRSSVENTKLQAGQFMTNFKPNEDGTDFYHSSYAALIDKNQYIRGFYNTLIPEEIIRLKKDIRILLD